MSNARVSYVSLVSSCVAAALTAPATAQATIVSLGNSPVQASSMSPDGLLIAGAGGLSAEAWLYSTANNLWQGLGDGIGGSPKVSNGGLFVGDNWTDPTTNLTTAARWSSTTSTWASLPTLGSSSGSSASSLYDISADGQTCVGLAWVTPGEAHAFKWTAAGGIVDISWNWFPGWGYSARANGVSSDGSVIVGKANGSRGVRWSNGAGFYLPSLDPLNPAGGSEAYGVSPNGTYIVGNSNFRAYIWDAVGGMRSLEAIGTPGFGNAAYAWSVSDDGKTVVGWSGTNFLNSQAFIWREGMAQCESLREWLNNQGVTAAYTDWNELKLACDVSADGKRIAGYGVTALGVTESFLVTLTPPPPSVYCTSGTTTNGCSASIAASGHPDVAHAAPCQVTISGVEGQKAGIVFYSLDQFMQPWCSLGGGSSFLCVKAPTMRSLAQNSGGNAGLCNGQLTLDWNAFQLANPTALGNPWTAGESAYLQGWFRDPPACKTTSLSNAVQLTYSP